jgi:arsenate reductase
MTVTIYHNSRCSKSRQTLALIEGKGISPVIIEYLKDAPSKETLGEILDLLKVQPRDIMRVNDADYKENNLGDLSLSRDDLIEALQRMPKLIERPIVVSKGKAIIGRPPENVLDII